MRGRSLPYGDGITYWPVVEVVKQLAAEPSDPVAAAAISSLLGESGVGTSGDEIAWAFRKLLEQQAPLVVVLDDIQWGDETFLDLVESTALLSAGVPLLLLCMARPELVERRPGWPGTLRLEPLAPVDADKLIGDAVSAELRERIAQAAAGNPLFISEMLAMAAGNEEVDVPPTLKALLATRLDQLDEAERARARARVDRGRDLPSRRRAGARPRGDAGHDRGSPHSCASSSSAPTGAARRRGRLPLPPSADPRCRLRRAPEGGPRRPARALRRLAGGARRRARRAGRDPRLPPRAGLPLPRRARDARGRRAGRGGAAAPDRRRPPGAASGRTTAPPSACSSAPPRSCPPAEIDVALETELVDALFWAGKGGEALRRADALAERASAAGDRVGELCGRIQEALSASTSSRRARPSSWPRSSSRRCRCSRPPATTWPCTSPTSRSGRSRTRAGSMDAALEAYERAVAHARRAGLPTPSSLAGRAAGRFYGTTPVSELLAWLDEQEARERRGTTSSVRTGPRRWRCSVASTRRARSSPKRVRSWPSAAAESCSRTITRHRVRRRRALGRRSRRRRRVRSRRVQAARRAGGASVASTAAGKLAQALYALDRLEEADAWAGRAAELGASDDAITQMLWRQVRAKVLARRGEHAEAERLAREAVAIGDETDMLDAQGDAYADLAEVLAARREARRGGRRARAGARALRAQGQPRLGAARADATRRAPGRSAAMSVPSYPCAVQSSPS